VSRYAAGSPGGIPSPSKGPATGRCARQVGAPLEADATFVGEIEPLAEAAQKMPSSMSAPDFDEDLPKTGRTAPFSDSSGRARPR